MYFGNKLSKHSRPLSSLESMEPLLKTIAEVKSCSSIQNPIFRMLDMVFHFFKNIKKSDLILIDVYSTLNFYYAFTISCLSILFSKKYVLLLHGGNLPSRFQSSPTKTTYILKNAYKICAPSVYLQSYFTDNGFHVLLLPNCIDNTQFPFLKRNKIKPNLLYIRGFGSLYNPLMAIKTLQLLLIKFPEATLTMYGNQTGVGMQKIEEYIYLNHLNNKVNIINATDRKTWVSDSIKFDIMLSCPMIDNTPLSILEGMSLGLAIVSTNVGGIPFLLEHKKNALLVNSDDEIAMSKSVEQLVLNQEETIEIIKNAKQNVEKYYWTAVKPIWEKLFSLAS